LSWAVRSLQIPSSVIRQKQEMWKTLITAWAVIRDAWTDSQMRTVRRLPVSEIRQSEEKQNVKSPEQKSRKPY